jgi:hypothetical protein
MTKQEQLMEMQVLHLQAYALEKLCTEHVSGYESDNMVQRLENIYRKMDSVANKRITESQVSVVDGFSKLSNQISMLEGAVSRNQSKTVAESVVSAKKGSRNG